MEIGNLTVRNQRLFSKYNCILTNSRRDRGPRSDLEPGPQPVILVTG